MSDDVLICIFWETFLVRGKMSPQKSLSNTIIPWGSSSESSTLFPATMLCIGHYG